MRLRLTISDVHGQADVDALRSLRGWLADEPLVRRHAEVNWSDGASPGELGTAVDVLTLVLGTGMSALQLLLAVAQWRASRPVPPTVTITRTEPDGATVRIEATDAQALAAAAEALEAR
jgi:Effector Associated Constant Component 1